jgi:hypothetical protein
LSFAELKKMAKGRRIKKYYVMPRAELLHLLSLPELPKNIVVEKLTIVQLRAEAKQKNIRGFWNMSRGELVTLLYPQTPATTLPEHENGDPDQYQPQKNGDGNQEGS